jgi:hypothetical protein
MTRRDDPSIVVTKEVSHTMSFEISSVPPAIATTAAARAYSAHAPSKSNPADPAVKVEVGNAIPASPPAEVLDAISAAAHSYDRLAATDRALSFKINEATGKVVVSVHDPEGKLLFTVPGSKALDIAAGGTLDK